MDAIILAAGRNDRLSGHVPAYMKPLLVMDGHTLIGRLIQGLCLANRIIIVCSPENVKQVIDVTYDTQDDRDRIRYIVQPYPWGAIHAFQLGIELVTSKYTVLACGDNIIPDDHWSRFLAVKPEDDQVIISVRELPNSEAKRFTFFLEDGSVKEKEDPPDWTETQTCWIGPVGFNTNLVRTMAESADKLSTLFDDYDVHKRIFVEGRCSDIGVPGELP